MYQCTPHITRTPNPNWFTTWVQGFMDFTINVAKKFPNVKFEHATGYKRADTVSTYLARFYEGRAIQGHIEGKMTKSNIVGYIESFPISEVIQGIN